MSNITGAEEEAPVRVIFTPTELGRHTIKAQGRDGMLYLDKFTFDPAGIYGPKQPSWFEDGKPYCLVEKFAPVAECAPLASFSTVKAARSFVMELVLWANAVRDAEPGKIDPLAEFHRRVQEDKEERERRRQAAARASQEKRQRTLQRRIAQRLAHAHTETRLTEEALWATLTERAQEKYIDLADEIIDMVKEG